VGPALAGVLIAGVGVGWCFVVNALSYVAVLIALGRMDPAGFRRPERGIRAGGQLREGFAYVWRTPQLRLPILLVAVIGTFAFNYPVLLPLLAERTLHGNASTFTLLYSTMSVGSLAGALMVARRTGVGSRWLARAALAFAAALGLLAVAPTLPLALATTIPVGFAGIMVLSGSNSALQLHARPDMRGRVNALFSVVFLGSTPIGGPVAGWVAEHLGVRAGLGLGALSTALAGAAALAFLHRLHAASGPEGLAPAAAA
jgi:predicted MFS family arabinose efflux permease